MTKYLTLQCKLVDSRMRMEKELLEIPEKVEHQRELISKCEEDISYYKVWKAANLPITDSKLKKDEAEKRKALNHSI